MPKPYRVNDFVRMNNAVMRSLIRAGVKVGTFAILTVRGRKTGRPGHDYLVAPYGVVNWVRNLRAAGGQAGLRYSVLPYLDVDLTSPDDDLVRSARAHPVFRVQPVVES